MNLLQKYELNQINKANKNIPEFRTGDTLKVSVEITEGNNKRVQAFEGICIAIKRRGESKLGLASTFTVRKISNGEGVERTFHYYSPKIANIEVIRKGKVRRAKLFYMRDLQGKAARIKERK